MTISPEALEKARAVAQSICDNTRTLIGENDIILIAAALQAERDAVEHERAMRALRERCREVYQALGRNAMLRQGDPVETIFAFAKELISEREYVIGFNDGWDEGRAKLAEDRG